MDLTNGGEWLVSQTSALITLGLALIVVAGLYFFGRGKRIRRNKDR